MATAAAIDRVVHHSVGGHADKRQLVLPACVVATVPSGVGAGSEQARMAVRITKVADTAAGVLLPLIRALTT